ncbi:MAG: DUF3108 domain-containing protein [Pyrinomonadaceae bacterium]|nr:DUF3108 domain-containing protein [Pyrinomonadaceae bacterium]
MDAQTPIGPAVRIGEKITYNVSIEHLDNAAFAEFHVVSTGRLNGRDVIEMRSRVKTLNLASAALFMVDESTTTYMLPDSGLPLLTRREEGTFGLPKVTSRDFSAAPASGHDINTLLLAIRGTMQAEVYTLQADDRTGQVTVQMMGSETVRSDAGTFETSILSVQSDLLTERGISDLRVNFSNDENRIPVLFRFRTSKGNVTATAASVQVQRAEPDPQPTPQPVETPRPTPVPTPVPTPEIYVNDQPLSRELPFTLGERLDYRISTNGREIGEVTLRAESRSQFQGTDSLLLSATFNSSGSSDALFRNGDYLRTRVDPDTLTPFLFDVRFTSAANQVSHNATFDSRTGAVMFGGTPIEAPVGTHSVLSLLYAMRSFNLKASRDGNNPTNDTRVAVYWDGKATVFSLRPANPAAVDINGEQVQAQMVSITTNNPKLEPLTPRVWLSMDARRLPLRIELGAYRLDLVTAPNNTK